MSFGNKENIVDPRLEETDPTPNIHDLFIKFNKKFFWEKLDMVEVSWSSKRMTRCAGICSFRPRLGHCQIRLSAPLLSLRPRKDLVQTLLHEMIHAYLFVTNFWTDRNEHGPEFHRHMDRINKAAGTNVTVYHTFHDEVRSLKSHVWRCNGPCRQRSPYYGVVSRACNRAPGPNDGWFHEHKSHCSGTFIKIQEPPGYKNKTKKDTSLTSKSLNNSQMKKPEAPLAIAGSSGTPQLSDTNITEKVRDVWNSKFPSKRKSEHVSEESKKRITECNECGERVSADEMTSHKTDCQKYFRWLCECLKHNEPHATGLKNAESETTGELSENVTSPLHGLNEKKLINNRIDEEFNVCEVINIDSDDDTTNMTCPICNKNLNETIINRHIDECLNIQALRDEHSL